MSDTIKITLISAFAFVWGAFLPTVGFLWLIGILK